MEQSTLKTPGSSFNRVTYFAFILAGMLFFLFSKDLDTAFILFAMSMVFDPFGQKVKWDNRPAYQRYWLIIQVTLVFSFLFYLLFFKH